MMEGEVHGSFIFLFTDLDNDQTKEKEDKVALKVP